jgi:ADP-heptose:LPS heptosyltransferase
MKKSLKLKTDCRHYVGEKPCIHGRLCDGCGHYAPWKSRILIIKTGAMGDVLRTTSILPPLRKKHPKAKITWLASAKSAPLLKTNPCLDEIIIFDAAAPPALMPREFDLVLSLDKTHAECGLATLLNAKEKCGVGLTEWGTPAPLNQETDYYFSLGLSDDLKFKKNKKTYGEMILNVCGLVAQPAPPELFLSDDELTSAGNYLEECGVDLTSRLVGLVVGAGAVFANKTPSVEKWIDVIGRLAAALPKSGRLLILGGPEDEDKMKSVSGGAGGRAVFVPPQADVRAYAAALNFVAGIVCGDTLALHMAAALGRPAVALFGPTCHREIDAFGLIRKIVSPADCVPCYRGECDKAPNCMDAIETTKIVRAALELLK